MTKISCTQPASDARQAGRFRSSLYVSTTAATGATRALPAASRTAADVARSGTPTVGALTLDTPHGADGQRPAPRTAPRVACTSFPTTARGTHAAMHDRPSRGASLGVPTPTRA